MSDKDSKNEEAEDDKSSRRRRHSWREPNTWAEVKLMRGAGLGALWLTSGLLSVAAGRTRRRLTEQRARRLAKDRTGK